MEERGFAICEDLLSPDVADRLIDALERVDQMASVRQRGGVFAVRNLLEVCPEVQMLASSELVRECVSALLPGPYRAVRGIFFDKVPGADWKVPWHQDMTIAVKQRIEVEGYGPWSVKAGVHHVQPPAAVLEKMLTVRFHLDNCSAENGALRVIPGSHRHGKIPEERVACYRDQTTEDICEVKRGGALFMSPLLLHASSPAVLPDHRRVGSS